MLNGIRQMMVDIYAQGIDRCSYMIFKTEQTVLSDDMYAAKIHDRYKEYLCSGHYSLAKSAYDEYRKCKSKSLKTKKKALNYYHIKCICEKQFNKLTDVYDVYDY